MYSLAQHAGSAARSGAFPMKDAWPLVMIVDDDVSVRESVEALIRFSGWQARSFESAAAFLAQTPVEGPGCILLDIHLPDDNGLDLQGRIAEQYPELPILFLTGYGDVPMTVRAMKAGAAEFLTKPFDNDVLLDSVERAIETSKRMIGERRELKQIAARYASLSRREREVMHLIVAGLLNKQVGGELGISEITVKAHRGRLMEKMKARSFADLVKMSERLGLDTASRR